MAHMKTILPDPTQLHLHRLSATEVGILAVVETTLRATPCPACGELSDRVHSRYVCRVADVPWHGIAFRLQLHVRRLVCERANCRRTIFTERLPGRMLPYEQRTVRRAQLMKLI